MVPSFTIWRLKTQVLPGERKIKEVWGRYAKDQIIEIVDLKRRKKRNLGGLEIAEREVWFHKERTTRVALLKRLVGEFFCGGGGVVDCGGAWLSDQWGLIVLLAILEHSFHGKFWKLG
ncbi:hypothetical protein HAX54_047738 [Datura stramonium]|uniref:Uncharacterized protein n=1 Tax=Datura stramonium TaxID=4076 RepID=A0ABS8ST00_DATST|nr:hypothetical protein [Datura stramonium]